MVRFRTSRWYLTRRASVAALVVLIPLASASAQTEAAAYHDLSQMKSWILANAPTRGAMGQSGSLALVTMPIGALGAAANAGRNAHHHVQEQIMLGIDGSTVFLLGGGPYRLGSYGAIVSPSNSQHFHMNGSVSGTSTFIEFQPVLRKDWFPPHPKDTSTKSDVPAPVSHDDRLFEDLTPSAGWHTDANGASSKTLTGRTIRLTMWNMTASNAFADLAGSTPSEKFVYVMEGQVEVAVDSRSREMNAQTLAVISPTAKNVRIRSMNRGRAVVAVFESMSQ